MLATFEPEPDELGERLFLAAVHGARPGERPLPPPGVDVGTLGMDILGLMIARDRVCAEEPVWRGDKWEVEVWTCDKPAGQPYEAPKDPVSVFQMEVTPTSVQITDRYEDVRGARYQTVAYGDVDGSGTLARLVSGSCSTSLQLGEVTLATPDECCEGP